MECGLEATATARLQTPPGRGGIAVICVTGPRAEEVVQAMFRPLKSHSRGGEGVLQLGRVVADGEGSPSRRELRPGGPEVIDEAVVARRGEGSPSRRESRPGGLEAIEINIHGGPAVAQAVMELLARHGAQIAPAAPGAAESFALAHPLWDNPAIGGEMLEALPRALSALATAALTQQWSGGLSRLVRQTADRTDARARLEEATSAAAELSGLQAAMHCGLETSLRQAAARLARMDRLLNPPEVVLAGPPNVGKSTLANALVGRPVSIVHRAPGTTRDWVRELAVLDGVAVWLTDTAGLWGQATGVDAEANRRARNRAESADLVLLLHAGNDQELDLPIRPDRLLRVASKCDVRSPAGAFDVAVSAITGQGLDRLRRAVLEALDLDDIDPAAPMAFTPRQATLLESAAEQMQQARFDRARKTLLDILC
jgi:tRNA modification GTPase